MKRIGIFGGSFDPIHLGHLVLAEQCCDQLELDEVRFIPAHISPLKQHATPVDSKHRVEMVRLAICGNPKFVCDSRELDRQGVSYTIDTIASIREEFPDAELFLLLGADSIADLPRWKSPKEILSQVSLGAISRGGVGEPPWDAIEHLASPERWKSIRHRVVSPAMEISSSDLRERVSHGKSIRYLVPAAVETYIRRSKLYHLA